MEPSENSTEPDILFWLDTCNDRLDAAPPLFLALLRATVR